VNRSLLAALLVLAAPAAVSAESDSPAAFAPGTVSTAKNEYNLSVSDDGRTMVFARSEADFAAARIMVASRKGGRWSRPEPISFSDERWRDSDPWLTPDGKTLYFVSDRPTASRPTKSDLDIWRSVKKDGRWSPPEHLGDVVNGAGEELGPELHAGVLYFATARKSGMGGLDIYSARVTAGGFFKPELLPAPLNSAESESDFTLSRDGKLALFWRMIDGRGLIHVASLGSDGLWSSPTPLEGYVNAGHFNFTPALSPDGKRLSFASDVRRAGQPDGMADIFEMVLPSTATARPGAR
jgi:dipeptidyl aminopeptidase/acylaminoacyl peptidase